MIPALDSELLSVGKDDSRDIAPATIFCLGKIDRSSNKDGSDYPSMKFRHLEYFVAAAEEVELHSRSGSAARFSTTVQQANPRPGRRTEDGVVRETAQRSRAGILGFDRHARIWRLCSCRGYIPVSL